MSKLKFDVICPNLDSFFYEEVNGITDEKMAAIPKELQFKLFRSNGEVNEKNTSKLTLLQKLYVLFKSFNKRWFLVIEDRDNGLSIDDFKKQIKSNEITIEQSDKLISEGAFVLGSKELCESFAYLNLLNISPAYSFAIKGKNSKEDFKAFKSAADYFCRLLVNYEGNKKSMVMQKGITIPEFYVLIYLYDGNKKKGSDMYNTVFMNAYNSSKSQINTGLTRLQHQGYITRYSSLRHSQYSITALGKERVHELLSRYVFNF